MNDIKRLLYIIVKQLSHLNGGKGLTVGDSLFLLEIQKEFDR